MYLHHTVPHRQIHTDASHCGIGATLFQVRDDGVLRLVSAACRALSEAERRYATIEQEALGVIWACEKFANYIISFKVVIKTDHKPLVPLLSDIELEKIPARIPRFRMRLMRFHYKVEHISGVHNVIADALSCSVCSISGSDVMLMEEVELFAVTELYRVAPSPRLNQLRIHQEREVISRVLSYIKSDWPVCLHSHELLLHPYFEKKPRLLIVENVLVFGNQIATPQMERLAVLDKIHSGHLGITKFRTRATQSV